MRKTRWHNCRFRKSVATARQTRPPASYVIPFLKVVCSVRLLANQSVHPIPQLFANLPSMFASSTVIRAVSYGIVNHYLVNCPNAASAQPGQLRILLRGAVRVRPRHEP